MGHYDEFYDAVEEKAVKKRKGRRAKMTKDELFEEDMIDKLNGCSGYNGKQIFDVINKMIDRKIKK